MDTRYFTEDQQPLLTTAQAAHLAGVKPGTIRQWVARHHLDRAGLDDNGRNLYTASDVTAALERLRSFRRIPAAA